MRIVTDSEELDKVKEYMDLAAEVALNSTCQKSQRGAVIIKNGVKVGEGYNKPTIPELCCLRADIHDNSQTELCDAIHAEQMAIITTPIPSRQGATMYHTKIKNSDQDPTGPPSCTTCSRMVLESGIKDFVLYQKTDNGPQYIVYPSEEFNKLSFDYHKS